MVIEFNDVQYLVLSVFFVVPTHLSCLSAMLPARVSPNENWTGIW